MRRRLLIAAMTALALSSTARAQAPRAQSPRASVRDLAALAADLDSVRADLAIVKAQLAQVLRSLSQQRPAQAARAAPAGPVRASIAGAPSLGRPDAPVTIVEFSDYQCPFCQRFFASTLPALKAEYVETGKVRYVFRDYPIDNLHPHARKAAEAAHCAGDQGKFWEMHDVLFQSSAALAGSQLVDHARVIGLDTATFSKCLSSGRHGERVEQGVKDAAAAGVQGTPGFVVGKTTTRDIVEGTPVRGAQPVDTFREIIERALATSSAVRP